MKVRVKKRGASYQVAAILGHNSETGSEIRKTYTRRTRKEADALASQLLEQAALRTYSSDTKTTFAAIADRWLAGKSNIRPHTQLYYERILRCHLIPALGGVKLADLGPMHVQETVAAAVAKGLSPKMVKHVYGTLRTILGQATKWRLIGSNPCDLVDAPRVPRKEAASWSTEQAVRYLAAAEGGRLYALLYLTVATGLRRGEVLGLRWSDVDLQAGIMRVVQAVTFPKGHASIGEVKTPASVRTIALSPSTVAVLRQHRGNVIDLGGERIQTDRLLFASRNGTPVHTSTLYRAHDKAIAGAGVPHIPFHSLRHSTAAILVGEGVPLLAVSRMLGHSDIQTTANVYGHVLADMERQVAAAFDTAISRQNHHWAQNGHMSGKK